MKSRNTNYKKTFLVTLICISMVLTSFLSYAEDSQVNNSNGSGTNVESQGPIGQAKDIGEGVSISIAFVKDQVASGEVIQGTNKFTLSSTAATLVDPYILVTIPGENISEAPIVSTMEGLKNQPTVTFSNGKWVIKFEYNTISAGTTITIPFNYMTDNGKTPDGFTTEIHQALYSSEGTLVKENSVKSPVSKLTGDRLTSFGMGQQMAGFAMAGDSTKVDPNKAKPVEYLVRASNFTGEGPGAKGGPGRIWAKISGSGGVLSTSKPNGWVYDDATGYAYKDISFSDRSEDVGEKIYLEYPGASFGYKELSFAFSRPGNDGQYPVKPDASAITTTGSTTIVKTEVINTNKTSDSPKSFYIADERDKVITWTISPTFITDDPVTIEYIEDEPRGDGILLSKFSFTWPENMTPVPCNLVGIKADGTSQVVEAAPVAGTEYDISGYKKVRLVFTSGLAASSATGGPTAQVKTTFNLQQWDDKTIIREHGNSGTIGYKVGEESTSSRMNLAHIVSNYNPEYYVLNSLNKNAFLAGEKGTLDIRLFTAYVGLRDQDSLKAPKIVVFVPNGVEPDESPIYIAGKEVTPKLVKNFNNSGKDAIVLSDIPDLTGYDRDTTISLDVNLGADVPVGANKLETYVYSDSAKGAPFNWSPSYKKADQYDINNNGDTAEFVGYGTTSFQFSAPEALIGTMKVSKTDGNYRSTVKGLSPGDTVFFQGVIRNNTSESVTDITINNVLPRKDERLFDASVRGSEYDVFLKGRIIPPAGYEAIYLEGPYDESSPAEDQYKTADDVSNWKDVKAIILKANSGISLAPSKSLEFKYSAVITTDYDIADGQVAKNSFDYKSSNNTNRIKCNAASAIVNKGKVTGTVFRDKSTSQGPRDGVYGDYEATIWDRTVTVINVDTNEEWTGTSDNSGAYSIQVPLKGNYKVKHTPVEGEAITIKGIGGEIANSFDPITGLTEQFTFADDQLTVVKDLGLYYTKGTIKIWKTDEMYQPLTGVVFTVTDSVTGKATEVTTLNGGADVNNLVLGREYQVVEKSAPEGYYVPPTIKTVTCTEETPIQYAWMMNRKVKTDIKVTVVDKDDHTTKLSDVTVKLQPIDSSGNPVGEAIEKNTDQNGQVIFGDSTYGKYQITQKTTKDSYIINPTVIEVSVTKEGEEINQVIENEKVKGNIIVNVVDKENPAIKLAGAKVKVASATGANWAKPTELVSEVVVSTDINGQATITGVPLGDYQVTQVETVEGYVKSDLAIDISLNTGGETKEVTIENPRIRGTISVDVVDSNNKGLFLKDATVQLQRVDKEGKPVGEPVTAVADGVGSIKFENLLYGNYIVTQTTAPAGYTMDQRETQVAIRNNGEIIRVEILNSKIPNVVVEPTAGDPQVGKPGEVTKAEPAKTGDGFNNTTAILAMVTAAIVLSALTIGRKEKSK